MQIEKIKEYKNLYTILDKNLSVIKSIETLMEKLVDSHEDNPLTVSLNIPKHITGTGKRNYIAIANGQVCEPDQLFTKIIEQIGGMPDYQLKLSASVQIKFLLSLTDCIKAENVSINDKIKAL
jgi:hypothetical protein